MGMYILISASNILCFLIGAMVGQRAFSQEKILRTPNEIIEEKKEIKEHIRDEENFKILAENIDNYNGTSIGQKDLR